MLESVHLDGANLVTEIAKICEQQWHERGERMGCPVGRVRSRLSEGSAENREENMLSDGQRKWMRECYLCQKLWLLFSQDSPLITPPSLLFTPIFFSCIALPQLFHFLPPPSPPSQCFAPSRFFFLISFSLWVATKGWRSGSDVWMSSTNLPVKGEKKVTEQEAGESTPKWWRLVRRGVFPFWNLEFQLISSRLLPSVFLASTYSAVLAIWNWEKWKFWEWGDEGGQFYKHAVGSQKKTGESPAGLRTDFPKILCF